MMGRLAPVLIAASLLSGCGLLGSGTQKQLASADAALTAGRYAEAAITLHNVVKKEPGNAAAQLLLARAQYLRGDADGVAAALDAAATAKADPAAIAEQRAQLALARGHFEQLLKNLDAGRYALPQSRLQLYRARAQQGLDDPVEALALYESLPKAPPDAAQLHVYVAECHAALGRPQQALQQVEKALALQPQSAAAWRERAILLAGSDAAGAQAALQKAIDLAPGQLTVPEQVALLVPEFQRAANRLDADAAGKLHERLLDLAPQAPVTAWAGAELTLIRGDPNGADATLQRLLQQAPEFAPGRPALVGALLAAGNFELAIQESARLVGSGPDAQRPQAAQQSIKQAADAAKGSEEQVVRGAAAALTLEQIPAARWILEQGAKALPQSEPIALLVIQQQLVAGQLDLALQRAQAWAQQAPRSKAAQAVLAAAEDAKGDFQASLPLYEALWKQSPSRSVALALAQARLRTRQGDALAPMRQWLVQHPDDVLVRTGLAAAAQKLGQLDAAQAEYEKVVAAAPGNAPALNNLALLYAQHADKRALDTARRALEAAPDNPAVADTYGWLLAQSGDVTGALPLLRKAAHAIPGNAEIRYHYAAVLARDGGQEARATARLWVTDLLTDPAAATWRPQAEQLLAQLPPT